ncbi:MAG: TatD family hydrolase [bacterium]|nr:TatD family hydrolase [bacterium]
MFKKITPDKQKMVNQMKSHVITVIAFTAMAMIMISCGGVANNPTSPNFNQGGVPGQTGLPGQPGAQGLPTNPLSLEDLQGQLSGGAAPEVEQIIQGNFETLWPQGLTAMENGQIVQAAQYFRSALSTKPDSADAALAYAITDIMRDHRRYGVFMHPGIDKLFMNTPLIGVSEVFPNPFLSQDSYFLRLAALGNRIRKVFHAEQFQVIAPVDTEMVFSPQFLAQFGEGNMMVTEPVQIGTPAGEAENAENITGPAGSPADETPEEDQTGDGVDMTTGENPTPDGGGQVGASVDNGIEKRDWGKQGLDKEAPSRPGLLGDSQGLTVTEQPFVPPAVIQERELPLSEDEWDNLITEYRDSARRDGADIFLSGPFYSNIGTLQEEIKEHINNLELVRSAVEVEGYNLILPFNVIDGAQKISMVFDYNDYKLLLDNFKLLDIMLSYVSTYNHVAAFELPTASISDTDQNSVVSPEEYLPNAPFGTIVDADRETLAALLPEFTNVLNQLNTDTQPLLDEAKTVQAGDPEKKEIFYLSSFNRNFVLIEEWNNLIRDIGNASSSGVTVKLESGAVIDDTVVVYDALFNNPVMNIRDVLPSFEASTGNVITDENGAWSADPTWGGFYPQKIEDVNIFNRTGKMTLTVYGEDMAKAPNVKITVGSASGTSDETGVAQLENATVNELMGTAFTAADSSGAELGSGSIHTLSEIIMLFDVSKLNILFGSTGGMAPPPSEETVSGQTSTGDTTGEDGIFTQEPVTGDGTNGEGDGEGDGDLSHRLNKKKSTAGAPVVYYLYIFGDGGSDTRYRLLKCSQRPLTNVRGPDTLHRKKMSVDTHCHLTLRFEIQEISMVLTRALDAGVHGAVLVGYDPLHYEGVKNILDSFGTGGGTLPALAGSVGIHPHEADKYTSDDIGYFRDELNRNAIIAIGETGLDFFRDYADRDRQKGLFQAQVKLSSETGYPLIVHSRAAFDDTISILREFALPEKPGVFHCYGYGPDELETVLDLGFYVSFAGNLTYPGAEDLRRACSKVPGDKVLIETDSPFLIPQKAKNRKVRRNEPMYVIETMDVLRDIKGWTVGEAGGKLIRNTLNCFPGLKTIESWSRLTGEI